MPVKILTFCGSLRAASSNLALLQAVERLAPAGIRVSRYTGIAGLPHFTPDLDEEVLLPQAARDLRDQVAAADGLLFAVPEYMHGLPGSLKNALDWMVGCQRFPGKPVALANVSTRHAFAPAQLEEILRTMAARIVSDAGFNLGISTNKIEADVLCADASHSAVIKAALENFQRSVQSKLFE